MHFSHVLKVLFPFVLTLLHLTCYTAQQHAPIAERSSTHQPSLGLSLGPEYITVVQSFPNETSGPIMQIEGSKSYQIWFADTAKQKKIAR